jgi:ribonucleoside-diphosphate reductase alpha chain
MDLWVREARLFKYGSGTGSNFSYLRGEGEKLSGGGRSSGLMSFLKIGDRAAGAIKSGGTTRRAAKMVVVDADHPDIEAYIDWKVKEEQKVAALVTGSKIVAKHLKAIMKACVNCEADGDDASTRRNPALKREIRAAKKARCRRTTSSASSSSPSRATPTSSSRPTTPTGIRRPTSPSPARTPTTRSRCQDDFLRAVENDGDWNLTARKDGKVTKTLKARDLWEKIGYAAWASADPGLHFNTTMNDWHTCAGGRRRSARRTRARNTCSSTTRPATSPRSTCCSSAAMRQALRHRRLRAHRAPVDHRARSLGDDGAVPVAPDRRALLRVPHARPRLRQYRRPLMTSGIPYDSAEGRAICRRAHRHHDRREPTPPRPKWPASSAPSRTTPNRDTCCASCATTAAPPTARPPATRPVGQPGRPRP